MTSFEIHVFISVLTRDPRNMLPKNQFFVCPKSEILPQISSIMCFLSTFFLTFQHPLHHNFLTKLLVLLLLYAMDTSQFLFPTHCKSEML